MDERAQSRGCGVLSCWIKKERITPGSNGRHVGLSFTLFFLFAVLPVSQTILCSLGILCHILALMFPLFFSYIYFFFLDCLNPSWKNTKGRAKKKSFSLRIKTKCFLLYPSQHPCYVLQQKKLKRQSSTSVAE